MKRPRFTLRDLFWLVLVCALAAGWLVERSRLHSETLRLADTIETAKQISFQAGVDEVERWLEHEAKTDEGAYHTLGRWKTEAKSWTREVELADFGERTP